MHLGNYLNGFMKINFIEIFIEIALRHGCSPVNLPHIFRTPFLKNTSGRLLLNHLICFKNKSVLINFIDKMYYIAKIGI